MMRLAIASGTVLLASLFSIVSAAAQVSALDGVRVTIAPTDASVDLGDALDLSVSVANDTGAPVHDLVVHLDITNADKDGSVDPEDWTPTLNQFVDGLSAGDTAKIDWTVQPISPGTFTIYAVVLSPNSSQVVGSNTFVVEVADRRSLDPQGILPVAIAVPAGLGLLLADRHRRTRR